MLRRTQNQTIKVKIIATPTAKITSTAVTIFDWVRVKGTATGNKTQTKKPEKDLYDQQCHVTTWRAFLAFVLESGAGMAMQVDRAEGDRPAAAAAAVPWVEK